MLARSTTRRSVVLPVLLAAACSVPPEEPIFDLVAELPFAEYRAEARRIDLGVPQARAVLGAGWSWDESSGEMTFVWSDGERSEIELFVLDPKPLELSLRCFAAPHPGGSRKQTVEVAVNGVGTETLSVGSRPSLFRFSVPPEILRRGANELHFDYAWTVEVDSEGSRPRRLAVGCDWLEVATGTAPGMPPSADPARGLLGLPPGSQTDFFLDLPAAARLRIDRMEGEGQVEISLAREGGEPTVLLSSGAGRGVDLELESGAPSGQPAGQPAAGPARLSVAVRGPAGASLVAPRIVAAAREPAASEPVVEEGGGSPSIVLYVIDTLRADRLGVYGRQPSLSPRIDGFAQDAVVFESAIAASSWTKPSVASILTGVGPLSHGVQHRDHRLRESLETLPERLAAIGYATAGFVGNPYFQPESGLRQGFERFELGPDREGRLQARALGWLESLVEGQAFFLYLHTVEPHAPYDPPASLRRQLAPGVEPSIGSTETIRAVARQELPRTVEVEEGLRRLYDAEVAYADRRFGEFLDRLRALGFADATAIVLTADHGEEFFEHGVVGHGWNLFDPVLSVPLIVRPPGGAGTASRVDSPAHQIDLAPTLLALAGADPTVDSEGRNLASVLRREAEPPGLVPSVSHMDYDGRAGLSVVFGDWKLIHPLTSNFLPQSALYDRRADPGERIDRSADRPVLAGYLRTVARKAMATATGEEAPPESFSPAAEAALEALGYLN